MPGPATVEPMRQKASGSCFCPPTTGSSGHTSQSCTQAVAARAGRILRLLLRPPVRCRVRHRSCTSIQRVLLDPGPQLHQRERPHAAGRLPQGRWLPRGSRRRRVRRLGFLADDGGAWPSRDVRPETAPPLATPPERQQGPDLTREGRGRDEADSRAARGAPAASVRRFRAGRLRARPRSRAGRPTRRHLEVEATARRLRAWLVALVQCATRRLTAGSSRSPVASRSWAPTIRSSEARASCSTCSWRAASGSAIRSPRRGGTERSVRPG